MSAAVTLGSTLLALVQGDITEQAVDAIVNAANPSLLGGGGVDGAIHRRGGSAILEQCVRLREQRLPDGLPRGEAVATGAGDLPSQAVIHTAGPIWAGGRSGEAGVLESCYRRSLELAAREGWRTVAFPSISTGVYGYPTDRAAIAALGAIRDGIVADPAAFDEVRVVLFSKDDLRIYRQALGTLDFRRQGGATPS